MSTRLFSQATGPLIGEVRVPGDKSLSHRAVLFASMAEGTSTITGLLDSQDVRSTMEACRALGATIDTAFDADEPLAEVRVTGWGSRGPSTPAEPLDCGNSGTTVRLLMGLLAGWPVSVTLKGDQSLSRRPMRRVTEPLSAMGARFDVAPGGTLPVTVHGSDSLSAYQYASPVASAQVKTAILLAGLRAHGTTRVTEPALSRDHTERLLPAFGVPVAVDDAPGAAVSGPATPGASDLAVPGDPSSAAFLVTAAVLVAGSRVSLPGVSLNLTRTAFLGVLQRAGADVLCSPTVDAGAEPVGTITAKCSGRLGPLRIAPDDVPALVDEVPILAVAAACAEGTSRFEGIGELRVKESDRLAAVCEGLTAMGVTVRSGEDWMEIDGTQAVVAASHDSLHDHRLAMSWAVAALVAQGETVISGWDAVNVSYPGFERDMGRLSAG